MTFFFAELNALLSCSEHCKLQHMLEYGKWHSVVPQYLPDHLYTSQQAGKALASKPEDKFELVAV